MKVHRYAVSAGFGSLGASVSTAAAFGLASMGLVFALVIAAPTIHAEQDASAGQAAEGAEAAPTGPLSDERWAEFKEMLRAGEKRKVKKALEQPGFVNRATEDGRTPLFAIGHTDNEELIGLVMAAGPDTTVLDSEGKTALIYVAKMGNAVATRALLAKGADADAVDPGGRGGLIYAAVEGNVEVTRALLEGGTDPNQRDRNGATALIYAAAKGFYAVPALLLEFEADPNLRTRDGQTAVALARRQNAQRVVRLLERHGAR